MIFLSTLIDNVQDWLENEGEEEEVIRAINRAIRQVEKLKPWNALRDTVTVTPEASGVILQPADCRVIRKVYPVGSYDLPETHFVPKEELDQLDKPITNYNKLLAYTAVETQLSAQLLVDVTQNNQTVTQSAASVDNIDESWIGERLMVEGDDTYYKITAATASTDMTVTPDIRRVTGTALVAKVRPVGLERYQLLTSSGPSYTEDVTIKYQKKHPNLVEYSDLLILPAEQLVTLTAVRFFLHQTKYDVSARELELEFNRALKVEGGQEPTIPSEGIKPTSTFGVRSHRNNPSRR